MTTVSLYETSTESSTVGDVAVLDRLAADAATGSDLEATRTVVSGEIVEVPPAPRAANLDPNTLIPRKARAVIGDLSDLLTSIPGVGIVCPLIVVELTGAALPQSASSADGDVSAVGEDAPRYQIFDGDRRTYAAVELGMPLVPCWIAPDRGEAQRILAQLAENGDRVALSATDEAEMFHQLSLLDWTPEQIATARSMPTAKVKQMLRLRELPEAARNAADAGVLTLQDAAAIGEFAESPAALQRLLKAAGSGWGFQHALATERGKRDFASAKDLAKANLVIAGVKVTSKPKQWGYGGTEVDIRHLIDADGQRLDPEQVRALPGFAAFVEKSGSAANTVVYCTDPEKYGYTKAKLQPWRTQSPEQLAAQAEADRLQAERLEQLSVAAGVRRDFIRATYGNARAARKLFPEALREAVGAGHGVRFSDVDDLHKTLGGGTSDETAAAKEDKLRRCLVARWICAHESNLAITARPEQWGLKEDAAVFWYDQLVADGYLLADAEAELYLALTAPDDDVDEDLEAQNDVEPEAEVHNGGDGDFREDRDGPDEVSADGSAEEHDGADGDTDAEAGDASDAESGDRDGGGDADVSHDGADEPVDLDTEQTAACA
jgi:ParB/RepB/Spo0J family partition protein